MPRKIINSLEIKIPRIYQEVLQGGNGYYLIKGGRLSGKSKNACLCAILYAFQYPHNDIIICRANYTDLETSLYNELIDILQEFNMEHEFTIYKQPLRIERNGNGSVIYFTGIAGKNGNRTKGIKTKHAVSIILIDEAQELTTQNEYEQALASFRRRLDMKNWKIITMFNPPAQNSFWLNVFFNIKRTDKDYHCITTTYFDILDFINDIDLKEIIKDKKWNYEHYKWFYMGETGGGFGSVYPMFHREKFLLKQDKASFMFLKEKIVGMIIGVDSAVNRDCTSFIPMAIMSSGRVCVLKIFHHDPVKSGIYGSQVLVQNFVSIWFSQLRQEFNLDDDKSYVPIIFSCDSAGTELIQALKYYFSERAMVLSYKKPTILQMVDRVQGAIAKNMVYVVDYGGYYDFVRNVFVRCQNPLAEQLENLIWNDKQTGYNPAVPNDDSDAFTYAVNMWFSNPENIHWLEIAQKLRLDYYEVDNSIEIKRKK